MKTLIFFSLCFFAIAVLASCDMRSETAKKEMEKFSGTPTPPVATPTPDAPVDPADAVQVDTSLDGDTITLNLPSDAKKADCTKYNRVRVNGDGNTFNIKGVCRQIMVNGDRNQIAVDAAMEYLFNGSENNVKYAHYANGKRPSIIENQSGNVIEKVSAEALANDRSKPKTKK